MGHLALFWLKTAFQRKGSADWIVKVSVSRARCSGGISAALEGKCLMLTAPLSHSFCGSVYHSFRLIWGKTWAQIRKKKGDNFVWKLLCFHGLKLILKAHSLNFVLIFPLLGPWISSKCKRDRKISYFFPLEVIQMQSIDITLRHRDNI